MRIPYGARKIRYEVLPAVLNVNERHVFGSLIEVPCAISMEVDPLDVVTVPAFKST